MDASSLSPRSCLPGTQPVLDIRRTPGHGPSPLTSRSSSQTLVTMPIWNTPALDCLVSPRSRLAPHHRYSQFGPISHPPNCQCLVSPHIHSLHAALPSLARTPSCMRAHLCAHECCSALGMGCPDCAGAAGLEGRTLGSMLVRTKLRVWNAEKAAKGMTRSHARGRWSESVCSEGRRGRTTAQTRGGARHVPPNKSSVSPSPAFLTRGRPGFRHGDPSLRSEGETRLYAQRSLFRSPRTLRQKHSAYLPDNLTRRQGSLKCIPLAPRPERSET
ncbi:hypothetical protein CALVIDRAFT_366915 [Calocera viscosa TUFC12733]|uniref:Uncharacterized protein n=1 Tax=Calocera viscosa (strain TUFC12733) TaxID=1330018 RepID=A0A167H1E3_CALVF|nr:hypothetical protein CALVIDRAFT_366915 [Calocera viscosa TUFC12733]